MKRKVHLVDGGPGRPWPPPGLFFALVALAVLPVGCSNDGARLVPGLSPSGTEISLRDDVQPIFTTTCALTGCHLGSFPAANMSLEAGGLFAPPRGIVGVSSIQVPALARVEPGNPDASYLVDKIQGTFPDVGGMGVRMPSGSAPLNDAAIATIRTWIAQGAMDN